MDKGVQKSPRKRTYLRCFPRIRKGKDKKNQPGFQSPIQRRNEPVKYDRKLMQDTVKAVKKISAIRQKREAHHILSRLAVSKVNSSMYSKFKNYF